MITNIGNIENRKRDQVLRQFIHDVENLNMLSNLEMMCTLYDLSQNGKLVFFPHRRINDINNLKKSLRNINDEYNFNTDINFLEMLNTEITLQDFLEYKESKSKL